MRWLWAGEGSKTRQLAQDEAKVCWMEGEDRREDIFWGEEGEREKEGEVKRKKSGKGREGKERKEEKKGDGRKGGREWRHGRIGLDWTGLCCSRLLRS